MLEKITKSFKIKKSNKLKKYNGHEFFFIKFKG